MLLKLSFDTMASRGFSGTPRVACIGLHQRPFKCWNCTTQYADFHSGDAKSRR